MPRKRKRALKGLAADMGPGADGELGLPMEVVAAGGADMSLKVPKWEWRAFTSSARSDGLALRHWEKAAVVRDDYVFAQFCAKEAEVVQYNDEEYERFCHSRQWTKEMTDVLIALAKQYGCRWHVVADRLPFRKSVEEIKERYYTVVRNMAAAYCAAIAQRGSLSAKALAAQVPVIDKPYSREYEERRKKQANAFFFAPSHIVDEQKFLRAKLEQMGLRKPKPARQSASATADERGPAARVASLKRVAAKKARASFRKQLFKHLEELRASGPPPDPDAPLPEPPTLPPITPARAPGAADDDDDDDAPPAKRAKTSAMSLAESVAKTTHLVEFSKKCASRTTRGWIGKTLTRLAGVLSDKPFKTKQGVILRSRQIRTALTWAPPSVPSDTVQQVDAFLTDIGLGHPHASGAVLDAYRQLRGQTIVLAEMTSAASNLFFELEVLRKRAADLGLDPPADAPRPPVAAPPVAAPPFVPPGPPPGPSAPPPPPPAT